MSEILSLWLCHAIEEFYDLLQVAYFNAWKGHMGRNIGILFAWMVVSNAALPFVMKWLANKKAKAEEQKPTWKNHRTIRIIK